MLKSLSSKRGQGMTEYIIIVALIAIAAITAFTFFGGTVRSQVGGIAAELGGDGTAAKTARTKAKSAGGSAAKEANKTKGLDSYGTK